MISDLIVRKEPVSKIEDLDRTEHSSIVMRSLLSPFRIIKGLDWDYLLIKATFHTD